jgi:phage tail-like protein
MSGCVDTPSGFLVLVGAAGWRRGLGVDLDVGAHGLSLAVREGHALSATLEASDLPPELAETDFAVGRCGLLYLLLETAEGGRSLALYDPRQARTEPFECFDGTLLADPSAVAWWGGREGSGGTLFVGDLEAEHRIVALSEIGRQIRWTVSAERDAAGRPLSGPAAQDGLDGPLFPVDLAVDTPGNLYVLAPLDPPPLDGDAPATLPAGGRLAILVLDPGGRRIRVLRPPELTLSAAAAVADLPRKTALAAAPDGSLWVLDAPGRRLLRVPADGGAVEAVELAGEIEPAGLAADRAGRLYVGDGRSAPAAREEDTRFIHRFDPDGVPLGSVSGYRGQVRALAVDGRDRIVLFDRERRRIVILTPETALRGTEGTAPSGVYYSPPLDSTREGTRWHRIHLEREIPDHTRIRLAHRTLETDEELRTYRNLLAAGDTESLDGLGWSEPLTDPRDALVRGAPGRHMAVRLELEGVEGGAVATGSPRVARLEAHFPRRSLLSELPAVYRREAEPDGFLERFLALFGTLLDGTEQEIDDVVRHFDARAVSGDFLRWLASWLALAVDATWTESRLRELILRAPELYRMRGTRAGIAALVELFTGRRPMIFEHFQLRCARDAELLRVFTRLVGDDPYHFCVLLPPRAITGAEERCGARRRLDEEDRRAVERVMKTDAPAHTRAGVRALTEWIVLDHHTYLGVNTWLPAPTPRLGTGATIPMDSVLTDVDEAGQVERRSRIELDTGLS